tara:strand:- start:826 stop:1017 length:192 start_codon:yes stop_codon:yes gene_type:complete
MKQTLLTDDQIKYVIESLGQRKTNANDPIKVTDMIALFKAALEQEPYEYFKDIRMMPWLKDSD